MSRPVSRAHLIVHGHFYQPPRENPWSGAVERQAGAAPYHDWNARISAECYRRLAFTRLLDGSGRVADVVNAYAFMSFNVGPTLLSWLEAHDPGVYGQLLEADRAARARTGRGGAMAQAYTHAILPLSAPRDRQTHLRWGIADFRHRFGRDPEGLWLPETAADAATLVDVAAEGIRFAILAPFQAARWRESPGRPWREVRRDQPLPTGHAYRWLLRPEDPASPRLNLLFYQEEVSRGVAFEGLAGDPRGLAARVAGSAGPGELVLLCSDGETYGHHHTAGHRGLAELLVREAPAAGLTVTTPAAYLAAHPPARQVELRPVSAWSCAHGVGRWAEDCGCETGGLPGWHQRWRRPLRRALERLRDEGHRILEEAGGRLFRDPWAARDGYVEVLLAAARAGEEVAGPRVAEVTEAFLAAHGARPLEGRARVDALALLEMQRHLLLADTSCAWFFADLAGIEALQNLAEVARAIELGTRFTTKDLEAILLDELRWAESNRPEEGDGRRIWARRVRPLRRPPELALAAAALRALAGDGTLPARSHGHILVPLEVGREVVGGGPALWGGAGVEAPGAGEVSTWGFLASGSRPAEARCYLLGWSGEDGWHRARALLRTMGGSPAGPPADFGGVVVGVAQLPEEDRSAVVAGLAAGPLGRLADAVAEAGAEGLALAAMLREAGATPPPWLAALTGAAALEAQSRAAAGRDAEALVALLERALQGGPEVDEAAAAAALDGMVEAALDGVVAAPGPGTTARVSHLLAARERVGVPADPERWDPWLARILAALPPLLDGLGSSGDRGTYEAAAALLQVAEALGAALPGARARLRPWEERLAADPAYWP